jgi:hypothetical protein
MGYGNRPTMPNNGYQKSGFNKPYNQKKNNFNSGYNQKQQGNKQGGLGSDANKFNKNSVKKQPKKNNNFTFKSDDDIYSPKVYAKKPKEKSMFDDIIIPEYIEDRQRMRNKRANDKKYKNKNRRDY